MKLYFCGGRDPQKGDDGSIKKSSFIFEV